MFNESFGLVWAPRVLSVLRIVAALLFIEHGTQKLFGFPIAGPPVLSPMLMLAAGIEAIGGLLLLIGLFTRPVAFILSGEMAVAYFMVHATRGMYPAANGGDAAVLYCFVFLYLAVAGGGLWSVDATRARA